MPDRSPSHNDSRTVRTPAFARGLTLLLGLSFGLTACFAPKDHIHQDADTDAAGTEDAGSDEDEGNDNGQDGGPAGDDDDDDTPGGTAGDDDDDDVPGDDDDDDVPGDDDDDDVPGDDDDDDDDDDTGEPASCEMGSSCLAIPAGFIGPIAVDTAEGGEALPGCAGAYDTDGFVAFQGLSADAAECTCDCDTPADVECPPVTVGQYADNGLNCSIIQPENLHNLVDGCNDLPFYDDVRFRLNMPDIDLTGVSCNPSSSETVPEAQWATQFGACEPAAELDSCDAGTCVPDLAGDDQRLCVWAPGDVECTGDVFTEREVIYDEVADSRGCSECSCGEAQGSCDANLVLRAGEGCSAGSPGSGGPGECYAVTTPVRSADLDITGPDVGCSASGGAPEGEAAPSGSTTLCCAG